jgi:hypothetical protein
MSYFTASERAALIANPAYIATLYANNRARFVANLGPYFAPEIEENIKLGFCGIVAYDLKPYGASTASSMADLLAAPALVCDNYAMLAWRLFKLLVPSPTIQIAFVGWNGGAVGNHCQIFTHKTADAYGNNGGDWLVDPTIGLVLCAHDFDWIVGGHKSNMLYAKDFYWRTDLAWFHGQVIAALTNGTYSTSSLLYWTTDFDKFVAPPPSSSWMTPQSAFI